MTDIGNEDTLPGAGGPSPNGELRQRVRSLEARAKRTDAELYGGPGDDGLKAGQSKLGDAVARLERTVDEGFAEMRLFASDMRSMAARHEPPSFVWALFGAALAIALFLLAHVLGGRLGWW